MSELIEQEAEGTALTPIERANAVLKSSDIELHFQSMAKEAKEISTITNKDGYEQCHATRMKLREERVELNKKAKAARDDANAFSKAVIAEEKRLIGIIEPEEGRLHALQMVWEGEIARKKEEKAKAETERVKKITDEIDRIRLMPYNSATDTPTIIEAVLETLKGQKPDSAFAELEADAIVTWERACKELQELYARKLKQQEEAAALKIEQERVKAEAEALAKETAEREAIFKAQQEALRVEAEALAKEQAAHDAKVEQARKQEAARMAALEKAERAQQEAEEKTRKAEERNRLLQETVEAERKQSLANQAELDKHRELASGDKWSNEHIGHILTDKENEAFDKIFGEPEHEPEAQQKQDNKLFLRQTMSKEEFDRQYKGTFEPENKELVAFQSILEVCRTWRDYEFPRLAIEAIEKIAREQVEEN